MANWYASLTGTPTGNGSLTAPWDLPTALNQPSAIAPGDTLYLRAGVYRQPSSGYGWVFQLRGSPSAPIIVRPYPGEHAALDLFLYAFHLIIPNKNYTSNTAGYDSHDVQFWNLEIFNSQIQRSSSQTGNNGDPGSLLIEGANVKFIHCYTHDVGDCLVDALATGAELHGCIHVGMGWDAPDRPHGHALYLQGKHKIKNCFFLDSFDVLVQFYGASAASVSSGSEYTQNTGVNGGAPTGTNVIQYMVGQNLVTDIVAKNNVNFVAAKYQPGYVQIGWGWDGQNGIVDIEDWLIYGPQLSVENWNQAMVEGMQVFSRNTDAAVEFLLYDAANPPQSFANWVVDANTYGPGVFAYGSQHVDATSGNPDVSNTHTSDPSAWQKAIGGGDAHSTFNAVPTLKANLFADDYTAGIGYLTIFNPASLATVAVDISTIGLNPGDPWQLLDVQNMAAGPLRSGVYSASSPTIQVPMTGLSRAPLIGWGQTPDHTCPLLGTFLVIGGAALDGSWTPPPILAVATPTINSFTATLLPSGQVSLMWSSTKTDPTQGTYLAASDGCNYGSVASQPTSPTLVTPAASTGSVTYTFSIKDAAGNLLASQTAAVTLGSAPPAPPPATYTWSVAPGSALPPGLALSQGGVMAGTPTQAGSFAFSVACSSGTTVAATLQVAPAADPAATPITLPAATVGQPYSYTFTS